MKGGRFWVCLVSVALTVIMLLLTFGACQGGTSGGQTLKLGIILEMTGPASYAGKDLRQAVELRLQEANYTVAGKKIQVIWEDDASDPTKAIEKAKKLIELDKVDLLYGPAFTDAQEAMSPYIASKKMMDITPVAGSWEMVKYGNWILIPSTSYTYATPLADYAIEQGYKTVSTIGADYVFGRGVVGGFTDRFEKLGGKVVQQQWTAYGTPDYAPYFSALKPADFLSWWQVQTDQVVMLNQYYELGIKLPLLLIQADNFPREILAQIGPKAIGTKGIVTTYHRDIDFPVNNKFVDAYHKKWGEYPLLLAGAAYSAMSVYLAGLEATGGDTHIEALKPAILKLNLDLPIGQGITFSPNGIALSNRYIVEVRNVNNELRWVTLKTYTKIADPRDTSVK